jgi:hypothetical protein
MTQTEYGRTYNTARREQGFTSPAHLDAFYVHYDHVQACTDCHPGAVLTDDGWQGTVVECDEAHALYVALVGATR